MKAYSAAGFLALASTAYGQSIDKQCPNSDICYSLNIPDSTASSNSGDIYLQITASTSYSWVAIGQGSSMLDSNMFIIYTDSSGSNVTVSPRLGSGYEEPKYTSDTKISILDGTGVSNGVMTANFKCSSCSSWSGGSMDFSDSNDNGWIHAFLSGDPLDSSSTSATIDRHNPGDSSTFQFVYSAASGGSSANPFATGGSGSGSSSQSCIPRSSTAAATATANNGGSGGSTATATGGPFPWGTGRPTQRPTDDFGPWGPHETGDNDNNKREIFEERASLPYCDEITGSGNQFGGTGSGFNGIATDFQKQKNILITHGVMACLAFAFMFPVGAIAIRLLSFPGSIWLHAGLQIFAYILFIVAFGLGIWVADQNPTKKLSDYHPVIGIVLFILLFLQPILGWMHHALYKKYQERTFWSYGHIWLGRIVITLGIINGGLGLMYAKDDAPATTGEIAAYGVVAGIIWLIYIISIFIGERRRAAQRAAAPPKYTERNTSDDSPMTPPTGWAAQSQGRQSSGRSVSPVSPVDGGHEMEYYGPPGERTK